MHELALTKIEQLDEAKKAAERCRELLQGHQTTVESILYIQEATKDEPLIKRSVGQIKFVLHVEATHLQIKMRNLQQEFGLVFGGPDGRSKIGAIHPRNPRNITRINSSNISRFSVRSLIIDQPEIGIEQDGKHTLLLDAEYIEPALLEDGTIFHGKVIPYFSEVEESLTELRSTNIPL